MCVWFQRTHLIARTGNARPLPGTIGAWAAHRIPQTNAAVVTFRFVLWRARVIKVNLSQVERPGPTVTHDNCHFKSFPLSCGARMRVLTIVHQQDAGPGVFLDPLEASGAEVDTWRPPDSPEPPDAVEAYDAVLSFGGDAHPTQHEHYPWLVAEKRFLASALKARTPMLGVCLGAELIAEAEGTATRRATRPEIGWYDVKLTAAGITDPVLGPTGP